MRDVTLGQDSRRSSYRKPDRLKLSIEYEGEKAMGVLESDDPDFVAQLCEKLKSCIGMSIQDIGNLEVEE